MIYCHVYTYLNTTFVHTNVVNVELKFKVFFKGN